MENVSLGGYSASKTFAAQQVSRGGKTVYIISLPIQLVPVHLPVADPTKPIELNRQVIKSHAEDFGDYWLKNPESWTVPPLLVDTQESLRFEQRFAIENGPVLGVLSVPDYSNKVLRTLDGQHRIYGWFYVSDKLFKDLSKNQEALAQANRTGTELDKQLAKEKVASTKASIARLQNEQVTLEIITDVTEFEHQTFFTKIADSAKGINASERTRMDETNMTSRVAKKLASEIELLMNRIEMRKASVGKTSAQLFSIANIRDIVRHACFGIKGKVTMAREQETTDGNAFDITVNFLRAMVEAIPAMKQMEERNYLPKDLRKDSLLGSVTIWRCLAGAYNDLAVQDKDRVLVWNKAGHDSFVKMVSELHKKMKITTESNGKKSIISNWEKTDCFNPGEAAPRSRAQDLRNLSALFTEWAKSGTIFDPVKIKR